MIITATMNDLQLKQESTMICPKMTKQQGFYTLSGDEDLVVQPKNSKAKAARLLKDLKRNGV